MVDRAIRRRIGTFKDIYAKLVKRHNRKNMSGDIITFDTYYNLTLSKCKYCGIEHSNCVKDRKNQGIYYHFNGVDRVDSNIGYTIENCVTCCKYCNFAKHTMNEVDFFIWINRIYNYNLNKSLDIIPNCVKY